MGTKQTPAPFDCYANALPDEPMFVLLGRDLAAPETLRAWVALRIGESAGAARYWTVDHLREAVCAQRKGYEAAQLLEALDCADAMERWRREHDGEWRAARKGEG